MQLQNQTSAAIQLSKPVIFGHQGGFGGGFGDVDATWRWGPPVSPPLSSLSLLFSPLLSSHPALEAALLPRASRARQASGAGLRRSSSGAGRAGRAGRRHAPSPGHGLSLRLPRRRRPHSPPPLGGAARSPSRAFLADLGVPSMRPYPCSPRGPPCSSMPPSIPGEQGAVAAQPSPPPPAALNSSSPVRFPSISCAGSFPVLSSPDSSPHPVDSPTAGRPQRSSIATAAGRRRPASSPPLPTLSLAGELHRALGQLH